METLERLVTAQKAQSLLCKTKVREIFHYAKLTGVPFKYSKSVRLPAAVLHGQKTDKRVIVRMGIWRYTTW